ncbi:hypothetical protein N826_31845 [Skermanella aerolata KACC 11604]|nr:hypothetical protein N826_31845 [Skermanella aerolata KACC 11604]
MVTHKNKKVLWVMLPTDCSALFTLAAWYFKTD